MDPPVTYNGDRAAQLSFNATYIRHLANFNVGIYPRQRYAPCGR
jgi:hypothetical protein